MNRKETFKTIAQAILSHRKDELSSYVKIPAIGRVYCSTYSSLFPQTNGEKAYWLINKEVNARSEASFEGGLPIFKNSKLGGIFIKHKTGKCSYDTLTKYKRINHVEIEIFNRTTYQPQGNSAKEITINFDGEKDTYRFQYLQDLLNEHIELLSGLAEKKKEEENQRLALEKARQEYEEAQRKRQEELLKRLREEEEQRKQEEARTQAEIDRLEAEIKRSEENIILTQSFIREGVSLRSQHILDEYQEDAKRSHIFDGVPIVIEGGPGTGKTTTMIQRLKFLISKEALTDYEAPLTTNQINDITDSTKVNNNWLFFSPTQKLLGFLRKNMQEEDLRANDNNTTTLDTFAKKILMDYKLRMPNSDGPFKLYRHQEGEDTLILDSKVAIASFERFVVSKICDILLKISQLKTSEYPWHNIAVEIKSYCASVQKIKDITGLMNLLNSMQLNEKIKVAQTEKDLNEKKNKIALLIKEDIMKDQDVQDEVYDLFLDWEDEENVLEDNLGEDELDVSEDDDDEIEVEDFEVRLYKAIKPILRNLSLKKIDSKAKLSKRQNELYSFIKEYVDKHDLSELGHLEWFKKNFAFPCRGIESNIFNQIPKLYKEFRKEQHKMGTLTYKQVLLGNIIKKESGKQIHREELELIVGFINNLVLGVYKKSKNRFETMSKNKYIRAYLDNCKPVIGIDEATDYSLLDYYFIASFKHYEYSAITLCGDIMQGLNSNGIKDWKEIERYIPNLEIFELRESYRQLPTLLEMSKNLYRDDRQCEAPYSSTKIQQDNEPAPLCYVSDKLESKTRWMAKRIVEIFNNYGGEMPSVAILVGDDVDISEMIQVMTEQDILNGIKIEDCSENRESETAKCVRIFRLSDVKGMEFEAVFFYDIDDALAGQTHAMMKRYLYVGVSRATSHLAATFTKEKGNEDIIKYFNTSKRNWRHRS